MRIGDGQGQARAAVWLGMDRGRRWGWGDGGEGEAKARTEMEQHVSTGGGRDLTRASWLGVRRCQDSPARNGRNGRRLLLGSTRDGRDRRERARAGQTQTGTVAGGRLFPLMQKQRRCTRERTGPCCKKATRMADNTTLPTTRCVDGIHATDLSRLNLTAASMPWLHPSEAHAWRVLADSGRATAQHSTARDSREVACRNCLGTT